MAVTVKGRKVNELLAFLIILLHASHVCSFSSFTAQKIGIVRRQTITTHDSAQNVFQRPTQLHLRPILRSIGRYKTKRDGSDRLSTKDDYPPLNLNASAISSSSNYSESEEGDTHVEVSKSTKRTILSILVATTLNLLGFTLTSPLNPTLGQHFNLPTGASFGSLTSAYPAGMLLGQFTWPRLSDHLGRKKVLSFSLLGSGMGLSLQAIAVYREWSLGTFLATRIFTGIFSGSAPVAKAFLADIGDQHSNASPNSEGNSNKLITKYLGWRDAASTLSYMIGPSLGGILYETYRCWKQNASTMDSSVRWMNQGRSMGAASIAQNVNGRGHALAFVIGISALGSILASLLIMAFVRETSSSTITRNVKETKQSNEQDSVLPPDDISPSMEEAAKKDLEILSCPLGNSFWTGVATVCSISFLYHIADSTFFAFYPALLQNQLGFDPRSIGMSFTAFAAVSFFCSATSLSSKLIGRVGVVNACAAGLATIGLGLAGLATSASSLVGLGLTKFLTLGAASLYFAGVPLYGPTIPTMLLLCVPPNQRGAGKLFEV